MKSPDGKRVKRFSNGDAPAPAQTAAGLIATLAKDAQAYTLASLKRVQETQYARSEIGRRIQSAREAFAKRDFELAREIEKAQEAERQATSRRVEVARHVSKPAPKTMRGKLIASGDLNI